MNTRPHPVHDVHGGILITAVVIGGVLGIALAAAVSLSSFHNETTVRSGCWNKALVVAEAGVEEALAQLNNAAGTWSSNGWTHSPGLYSKQRSLGSDWYLVTVTTNATAPVIVSTASVFLPAKTNRLARAVRVNAEKQSAGMRGMVAKGKTLIKDFARTDSFDSSNPAYSTGGLYDPAKARDNGEISSVSTTASDVELSGDAKLNGKLSTGNASVLKIDSPASVGSFAWTATAATAGLVQPGYHKTDYSGSFPNIVMPSTGGAFPIGGGTVGGTNYAVLLDANETYYTSKLALGGSEKMLVTGEATLIVTDNIDVTGTSQIILTPTARLTIYVQNSAVIGGAGIANSSGNAKNFSLYGSSTCFQVYYSGTSYLIGTLYAPSAKMDLTGTSHFMGASVSNEIVLGGNLQFHYDEALGGGTLLYQVASWDEI